MCTRYTTRRVETTVAESLNNQLFNICERQLSLFSTVKPMTMKINARSGFVPTKRAANPRRPQKKKKKSVKMHRLFKWPGSGGLPFSAVSFQLPS